MLIDRLSPCDPNSYSRTDEAKVTNIDLDIEVDFDNQILSGNAILSVDKVNSEAKVLILDTRDLTINNVLDAKTNKKLEFILSEPIAPFGSKLEINLPHQDRLQVMVNYSTSPESTALQWMKPEQTSGKKYPFLFSQCEAIHCRSMVPCQDTPCNKITYSAKVSAHSEMTVLMSALREGEPIEKDGKRVHSFRQPVPIPSYLIAIVTGELQSRQIGPRTHVWAEPDVVDEAAYEFAETETMLSTAEDVCGPYVWGIYDLLVLPPSFPFGGMENPCLTFVTPTLLAGDRSLVDVIAHEISHSWTGNLVTNSNFEHFWLNEGFTVFVERKIAGRLHGEAVRNFSAIRGTGDLAYAVETIGPTSQLTNLIPDLTGIDPDDAFSTVPYEKGQTLLWYLEELVGGAEIFEPFLKSYIANFQYRSITSDDFVEYLKHFFENTEASEKLETVDWETWFKTPGMPIFIPKYDDTLAKVCTQLCQKWNEWSKNDCPDPVPFTPKDLKDFSPMQIEEFLAQVLTVVPLTHDAVKTMGELYKLDEVRNAEIRVKWLRVGLRAKYEDAVPLAIEFASNVGRMKYVRPIFRDLYNWEEMRPRAIEAYEKAKSHWMYVTAYTVGKDLHVIQ